jgi:S1-C subfamily serine protease
MRVFAIGNPFGLERTLTTGVISSLNRSLQIRGNRTVKSIIQIDAAINPGNSGGPLLDTHGRLIGLNTAIASKTGQSSGVGFAIPVNLASRVVPQLITHGRVIRPDVGIHRVYEAERGLLITQLVPGGPAEQAGLRGPRIIRKKGGPFVFERWDVSAADLIVAVDGEDVQTWDDFLSVVERKRPGDRIVVTVLREGRRVDIPLVLGGETPTT